MDYREFEKEIQKQALIAIPQYLSIESKEFVLFSMHEYSLMAGEFLEKTEKPERDKEYLQQAVAEWMFHKAIDLTKTDIPKEYWSEILKKITLSILNIAPKVYNIESYIDDFAVMVERAVSVTFEIEVTKLFKKEIITQEQKAWALSQSNLDDMAQEESETEEELETEEESESKEESSKKTGPSGVFLFFSYLGIAISIFLHIKGINEAAFSITCPIALVSLTFHCKERLK